MSLQDLVDKRRIIICAGSGGVGKTTSAAVLAMQAARSGRRAVVVTVDPAKRLADALGLSDIGNEPSKIDGDWDGEMWAVMLDTKGTFDDLVANYSETDLQAERILSNRFYRNISGALSGTQEYMAMEKLYALHQDEAFDLVVVDTPPTRHALDFLDAPRRLTHFLDHRLYRVLMAPTRGMMKAVNVAAQTFVRSVSKVVGAEALDDALAFFGAFSGMEEGFKARANVVLQLLDDPETAFVLVAAPRRDTVAEAQFFADRLSDSNLAVAALIVNRIHPLFTTMSSAQVTARTREAVGTELEGLAQNLLDFTQLANAERSYLEGLSAAADDVVLVPFLDADVHDVSGLDRIGSHLFATSNS